MELAVHALGGHGPVLLILHANGFLGQAYAPLVAHLQRHFCCLAMDLPGHGDSNPLPEGFVITPETCAAALLATMASHGLRGCFCLGHSAGGGVSLLAEAAQPGTFAAMYVFEPVSELASEQRAPSGNGERLAMMARRRVAVFASQEAAAARFAARPPLSTLDPAVLAAYAKHGLKFVSSEANDEEGTGAGRTADRRGPDTKHSSLHHTTVPSKAEGSRNASTNASSTSSRPMVGQWRLKCDPSTEAAYFTGFMPAPQVPVHAIHCPVLVAVGTPDPGDIHARLPEAAAHIAAGLPRGVLKRYPDLRHFGPLEQPALVAADAAAFFQQVMVAAGQVTMGSPAAVQARL